MPNAAYRIRDARSDDADAVTAMWLKMAAQHTAYNRVRWGWADDAEAVWRGTFKESVAKQDCVVLVAVDPADRPVGYLMAKIGPTPPIFAARHRGEVTDMFVCPSWRRKGVGKALLQRATDVVEARGAAFVVLNVASANASAIHFYETCGFRTLVQQMFMQVNNSGTESQT